MRVLVTVIASLLLPGSVSAVTFSTPIPDAIGVIEFTSGEGLVADFDYGFEFASIESVSLEIEAAITAAEFLECEDSTYPPACEELTVLLGFTGVLDEEDRPFPGLLITGEPVEFWTDESAPDAAGRGISPFVAAGDNPFGWDILLDGQGTVLLNRDAILVPFGKVLIPVAPSTGEIFDARIVVEGVPVPEPSTALLVGLGLALVCRWRLDGSLSDRCG